MRWRRFARWAVTAAVLVSVALLFGWTCSETASRSSGSITAGAHGQLRALCSGGGCCRAIPDASRRGPLMQMPVFLVLFFAPVYVPLRSSPAGSTPWRRQPRHVLPRGRPRASSPALPSMWRERSPQRSRSDCCSRSGPCAACAGPRRPAGPRTRSATQNRRPRRARPRLRNAARSSRSRRTPTACGPRHRPARDRRASECLALPSTSRRRPLRPPSSPKTCPSVAPSATAASASSRHRAVRSSGGGPPRSLYESSTPS